MAKLKVGSVEKNFGVALRDFRLQKGFTQESLAGDAGLSRNHVSELERGTKSPSLGTVFRLCKVLDLHPEAMIHAVVSRMGEA